MKKYPIEYISVPRHIVEIATGRTRGIVQQWACASSNTLEDLAASLYLQGIQDGIEALNKS